MSTSTATVEQHTPTATSAADMGRSALRRGSFWFALAVVCLVTAVAMHLLDDSEAERYGLGNTDLSGYAALAEVLQDEGVTLHRTASAEQARQLTEEHDDATVVIMIDPWEPEPDFLDHLAQTDREVIWISPEAELLAGLLDDVEPGYSIPEGAAGTAMTLQADDCQLDSGAAAQTLQAPGETLIAESGCFPVGGDSYPLVSTEAGTVFSAPEAFTNRHITSAGNASLALNLLTTGGTEEIIWYSPTPGDVVEDQAWADPVELLSDWMVPLGWWLLACGLIACLVAGRRTGPVVTEPLPVQVPSGEVALGRGRLYQHANASDTAARTLRSATVLRVAGILRLGQRPDPEAVIEAAHRQTGTDRHQLSQLLSTPRVRTNAELVSYARRLQELEEDLRRSVTGAGMTSTDRNREEHQ
ncbi:DUF4350 domain-containing protein [Nesterenkonia alba]|uniref:DUF4350 domain-containing protein n=1 Tax=Nesterenkonia alba TaxID=515814 RepID=UPI0003B4AC91|nr:DUF4350 domain-containing protein [Nesterenkonia alba]